MHKDWENNLIVVLHIIYVLNHSSQMYQCPLTLCTCTTKICDSHLQDLGPPWMLYNLAALYWRVIGNTHQGIECLRHSLYFVPAKYRDVPLVNLANVLYKLGQLEDAIAVMNDAVAINDIEVSDVCFYACLCLLSYNFCIQANWGKSLPWLLACLLSVISLCSKSKRFFMCHFVLLPYCLWRQFNPFSLLTCLKITIH